ncbi:MAG: hypothetical protein ACREMZ_15185 [Gemmatimonadales bacterium]
MIRATGKAAALAASLLLASGGWYAGGYGKRALQAQLVQQQTRVGALEDTLAIIHRAARVLQASIEMEGSALVRGAEVAPSRAGPQMFTTGMPEGGGTVLGAALTVEPIEATAGPPQGEELAHLML